MPIDVSAFRVREGRTVSLKKWPTRVRPFYDSKSQYQSLLAGHVSKLCERQNLLYAHDRFALLLIFQAMDAAGKDGVIKHVMSGVNPQGCQGERPAYRVAGPARHNGPAKDALPGAGPDQAQGAA